jgi:hypothetical protein
MSMKFNLIYIFIISVAIVAAGCGNATDAPANEKNTKVANPNGNGNRDSTESTLGTVKKPEAATENNAPTIGPVVQTYYEALRKKDDALVKSVMTDAFIKNMEADMKAEGKKGSLAAFMAEVESDLDEKIEVRNEKIEGNKAVAQLKGGTYLVWTAFEFVNEGGKWKFTGGSPVLK